MDQNGSPHNIFHLVALQVPDHMPSEILREKLIFVTKLLRFVLSEVSGAKLNDLLDHRDRLGLADNDQRDILSPASGTN